MWIIWLFEKGTYDRFRSRIIFPIAIHPENNCIWWKSIWRQRHAKYLNSPETPIYKKSEVFYGFNLTRESIIRENLQSLLKDTQI